MNGRLPSNVVVQEGFKGGAGSAVWRGHAGRPNACQHHWQTPIWVAKVSASVIIKLVPNLILHRRLQDAHAYLEFGTLQGPRGLVEGLEAVDHI